MPQTRETGATAAKFGHEAATLIGEKLGAKKLRRDANLFEWNGQPVTIRTARQGNNQVGVLYDMLERVQLVIAAFETAPDQFDLLSLSPEIFKAEMRDSKTNSGRVGLVRRSVFADKGSFLGKVEIQIT